MDNIIPTKNIGLKKLGPIHHQIIAMHLEGHDNKFIASALGRHYTNISIILNDPLVQKFITDIADSQKHRLRALMPLAVNGIRDNLVGGSLDQKLKASKMVLQSQGADKPTDDGGNETAEDVVKRIMSGVNIQINNYVEK